MLYEENYGLNPPHNHQLFVTIYPKKRKYMNTLLIEILTNCSSPYETYYRSP